jgi:hypothetical protein
MADTHPIFQRPVIHCGKCSNPLVFPHKREVNSQKIAAGQAVLGECAFCAAAVEVPAEMFKPSAHTHANTTVARPWPTPKAVLTAEQKALLGQSS